MVLSEIELLEVQNNYPLRRTNLRYGWFIEDITHILQTKRCIAYNISQYKIYVRDSLKIT